MSLASYTHAYFIGIGGIGMSALARYFKSRNVHVAGYDKTETPLTKKLQKEGIEITFSEGISHIPEPYKNKEKTLVVYTPAVPASNAQFNYFSTNLYRVLKRAQVLAAIANTGQCIAIGGTHGKTTTSSLVAHIFNQTTPVASAFLGGISANAQSNFVAGSSDVVVLEADEFDRSFHQLKPQIALITSMDADHLDIYENAQNIEAAFGEFASRVVAGGSTVVKYGLPLAGTTYGLHPEADYSAQNIEVKNGKYHFTLHTKSGEIAETFCGLPGRHNVENAVGAAAVCHTFGLPLSQIISGIKTFTGVARRFDVHVKSNQHIYVDDYAHHPAEIKALLASLREMYPGKKITAIFQPHLYSRTRDFASDFASALAATDRLFLLDIYAAREEPIPGVSAQWLLNKIEMSDKQLASPNEVLTTLESSLPELVVTMGAGDIDKLVPQITKILSHA